MWIFWNNLCESFSNDIYTNLFLGPLSQIVYKRRTFAPSPCTHINWHWECSKNDSSKGILVEKVYIFHEHKRILIIQRHLFVNRSTIVNFTNEEKPQNYLQQLWNQETFWNCLFNRLFSRIKKQFSNLVISVSANGLFSENTLMWMVIIFMVYN